MRSGPPMYLAWIGASRARRWLLQTLHRVGAKGRYRGVRPPSGPFRTSWCRFSQRGLPWCHDGAGRRWGRSSLRRKRFPLPAGTVRNLPNWKQLDHMGRQHPSKVWLELPFRHQARRKGLPSSRQLPPFSCWTRHQGKRIDDWVVVSNIFYVHPYLWKMIQFDSYFSDGWNHQLDDDPKPLLQRNGWFNHQTSIHLETQSDSNFLWVFVGRLSGPNSKAMASWPLSG